MKSKENNKSQLSLNFEIRSVSLVYTNGRSIQESKIDFSCIHYVVPVSDSYPEANIQNNHTAISCVSVSYKDEPEEAIGAKIISLMEYKRKSIIDYVLNHTKSF